jgi:hypothetical protein
MRMPERPEQNANVWSGVTGVAVALVAIGCCAVLPLAVALAGSIALGTLIGFGAGGAALIALVGLIVVRARRRAACGSSESRRA